MGRIGTRNIAAAPLLVLALLPLAGCGSSEPDRRATTAQAPQATAPDAPPPATLDDLKELLPPADAAPPQLVDPEHVPPLAELDAKAGWRDQPVLDLLAEMRKLQATETPLATVAEALALRNVSKEDNAKILSALGRLPASDAEANFDATINRHLLGDVKSNNPLLINSREEFDVQGLISAGLMGFDWNMNPCASKDSVVSWQTSADGMMDKIVMRNDLFWSDGVPMTAHDVAFSFRTILDPEIPIPAVRAGTDKIHHVHAYDDYTLVYFHKDALATNVWNINFPILPKHIYESTIPEDKSLVSSARHIELENNPVVAGPYRIASRKLQQEIVLERREEYYLRDGKPIREKPYFKTIRFRIIPDRSTALLAMNKGDIDELELLPDQWQSQTGGNDFYRLNTKASAIEWTFFFFGWNLKRPYFDDALTRRAMSYAFDYKVLFERLLYGLTEPCTGIFYKDSWMAPKQPTGPYYQDLDKAEELLAAAGWADHDNDGVLDKLVDGKPLRFEFTLLVRNEDLRIKICNLLRENLDQLGIVCNVRPLEATTLQQLTFDKQFDAYYGGWGTGADPDTSENIWGTGQERNFVSYSNPLVDQLFVAARKQFDRDKRGLLYGRLHELIYADQPYTFLYYQSAFYGFSKQLRGYRFSPRGPYHYGPGFGSIWKGRE
ncbi:MAG: peptide ABC transporter substrate-binding protein [Pirellulales bacterium]|nr:peptide ABC transporter substrate-binding protein [Pirellulales bacterium]